ncbi:hypothetical protein RFI_17310 [Reticulomyxa filosa]|uniref:Uncharacterized protein n=1 Tax=Reticulomyxa filosa TaxID=46433 RepID=X6N0X9_RETFI|nr:hypothetical protein RFI_17310 [Reticulomyxa filosa]|eukprot:ETO19910.1 hypothetical protein RFI_17310 [Reticulomyxa filosa]
MPFVQSLKNLVLSFVQSLKTSILLNVVAFFDLVFVWLWMVSIALRPTIVSIIHMALFSIYVLVGGTIITEGKFNEQAKKKKKIIAQQDQNTRLAAPHHRVQSSSIAASIFTKYLKITQTDVTTVEWVHYYYYYYPSFS